MLTNRLARYLLEEAAAPFMVGVTVILVMLLGDSLYYLMNLVIVHGVRLPTVARLLTLIMPAMLVNAFPLATILAVSLSVSRLMREGEWTAMRLAGCSLGRLVLPFAAFGAAIGSLTWVVGEHLAPAANREFVQVITQIGSTKPTVVLKPQSWFRPGSGLNDPAFYVGGVDDTTGVLKDLIVFTDLQSDYPTMLIARSAHYEEGKFILEHVMRHVWRADGTLARESEARRAVLRVETFTGGLLGMPNKTPDVRSASQLRDALAKAPQQPGFRDTNAVVDLHRRYAAPVACLVLALLCVPLNLLGGRRGGFMGLLISAVLVVVYFLMLQLGMTLGRNGALRTVPALGPWLQNIVFGALASWLLWRARR